MVSFCRRASHGSGPPGVGCTEVQVRVRGAGAARPAALTACKGVCQAAAWSQTVPGVMGIRGLYALCLAGLKRVGLCRAQGLCKPLWAHAGRVVQRAVRRTVSETSTGVNAPLPLKRKEHDAFYIQVTATNGT